MAFFQDAFSRHIEVFSRRQFCVHQETWLDVSRRLFKTHQGVFKTSSFCSPRDMADFFKTPFQDTFRCFQDVKILAFKTPVKFSRHHFKTPFCFSRHIRGPLENPLKRLEKHLCFLAVSSKFFNYVLKGVLKRCLEKVSWERTLASWQVSWKHDWCLEDLHVFSRRFAKTPGVLGNRLGHILGYAMEYFGLSWNYFKYSQNSRTICRISRTS